MEIKELTQAGRAAGIKEQHADDIGASDFANAVRGSDHNKKGKRRAWNVRLSDMKIVANSKKNKI